MTDRASSDEVILFEAETPLGFCVRTTASYWELISEIKHPTMKGREADIQATLANPDEVRLSKSDAQVYRTGRGWEPLSKTLCFSYGDVEKGSQVAKESRSLMLADAA